MQAATVSTFMTDKFRTSIEFGLSRNEMDDTVGALVAFSEARQTARLAADLAPTRLRSAWIARQNQATGYINAAKRRIALLGVG
jgi:hypothetical protein